jgi:hypothetical protein
VVAREAEAPVVSAGASDQPDRQERVEEMRLKQQQPVVPKTLQEQVTDHVRAAKAALKKVETDAGNWNMRSAHASEATAHATLALVLQYQTQLPEP